MKEPKFKRGDWIINENDPVRGVTVGRVYEVRDFDPNRGDYGVVYFQGDNTGRMRPAEKYRLVPSPHPTDDGADEYEMTMKGQELWASILKNSGA